ncbi:MAG: OB-fold nucleic acid binding domain-containing protein [Chloroflexota bacterium]
MSHCPSCGRYVGPHAVCPICGARMEGRLSMRVVKVAAMLLATVGLVVLWYTASRAEIPTVAIGRVGATMNLAYVRLAGRCTRSPSYDPDTGYLSFWIADETGELRVASYQAETRTLIEIHRVPALGDRITVAGTLRIAEDFGTLTLDVPEALIISRAEPVERAIGTIGLGDQYERVRVHGQVRDVREPYRGLTLFAVRDPSGVIDVAVSRDLVALSGFTPAVTVERSVEVVGGVSRYGDTLQVVPASTRDVVLLDYEVPIAYERTVAQLASADVGHWFAVTGTVTRVDWFSSGVKLKVDDGTGAVSVLLWDDVYEALLEHLGDAPGPGPGARVWVQGGLAEYRGELELIPELPVDVKVLAAPATPEAVSSDASTGHDEDTRVTLGPTSTPTPAPAATPDATATAEPTPTPTIPLTPIHSITADRVGEEVVLEGRVVDAGSLSKGFQFTLDDGTGQIVLLMWHNVYDDCWDAPKINLGATVRVRGEIHAYEGQLEIQPRFGGDVKVIVEGVPGVVRREIGSITGGDDGRLVMIEGRVVRTEGVSGAVKVFLADGSGEIVVFVWRSVLDRIEDNTGLGTPGSLVRVVGALQVYRANLEMVPALPNDVTVLEIP